LDSERRKHKSFLYFKAIGMDGFFDKLDDAARHHIRYFSLGATAPTASAQ